MTAPAGGAGGSVSGHARQPLLHAGAALPDARTVVVLLHGRGGNARDILGLAGAFGVPGVAYLAPQAAGNSWYPQRFLAPLAANQPWLDEALATVARTVAQAREAGVPEERIVVGGFSQGACLALEFACRHARRWGGVFAFSGGLIGPEIERARYQGDFAAMPAFLGCSDRDAHIPEQRVHASAQVLTELGAQVTTRIYPGMGHTINDDEVAWVHDLLVALASGSKTTNEAASQSASADSATGEEA